MHSCCLNDTFQQLGDYRFIYRRGRAAQFLCWFYASVDYSDSLSLEPTWYFLKRLIFPGPFLTSPMLSEAFQEGWTADWPVNWEFRLHNLIKNACNKQSHGSFYHHSWIKSQRYLKSFTWGSRFSSPYHLRMMLSIWFHWTVNSSVHWSGFKLQCDAAKMKISTFKSESMFPSKENLLCDGGWWNAAALVNNASAVWLHQFST